MYSFAAAVFLLASQAMASPIASRADVERVCGSSPAPSNFAIENFDFSASYTFTTPAHQNSYGQLSFDVANPGLAGEAPLSCSFTSSRLTDFFYSTDEYTCEGDDVTATVTYDRASGNFTLAETWLCLQGSDVARYTAKSKAVVSPQCTDSGTKVTENWTIGQIYSQRTITCDKLNFSAPITEISAVL